VTVAGVTLGFLSHWDFWIGVGVLAGVYATFALGLQLNVGFTGILNFGQAGFMAIGAYAMAILVADHGWPFLAALPVATGIAMVAGVVIGLPSLRLRADYFAIVTIAFAEIIRYVAQNARGLTGGPQGIYGYDDAWLSANDGIHGALAQIGLGGREFDLLPLLLVTWLVAVGLAVALRLLQPSPWGRVLRAIREDEDAARAIGKNTVVYKLQSLAIAAAIGSIAGYLLALNTSFVSPDQFEALFTFIGYAVLILGGLASYAGVLAGSVVLMALLEGTRFLSLPLSGEKVAALRLMIVGVVLMALAYGRPEGMFGRRQEMVLHE
jgi:branched-chain amino acid transport system permease protein